MLIITINISELNLPVEIQKLTFLKQSSYMLLKIRDTLIA